MEALYTCIAQEYKDCPFTSINIKPTYTIIKGKNVVTLTIDIFNKYHNCLKRQIFKFINDRYHPTIKKSITEHYTRAVRSSFQNSKNGHTK